MFGYISHKNANILCHPRTKLPFYCLKSYLKHNYITYFQIVMIRFSIIAFNNQSYNYFHPCPRRKLLHTSLKALKIDWKVLFCIIMHMLMYVLFSTPTWCKGTVLVVYFGVMYCTVLINDNNCKQSQHTSKWIMKLPGKYLEHIILMVSIALLKWFIFCQGMNT